MTTSQDFIIQRQADIYLASSDNRYLNASELEQLIRGLNRTLIFLRQNMTPEELVQWALEHEGWDALQQQVIEIQQSAGSRNNYARRHKRRSVHHHLPAIVARDRRGWVCHYCERPLVPYDTSPDTPPFYAIDDYGQWQIADGYRVAVVDHIVPVSQGGNDDLSNLVAACRECNQEKLDTRYDDFVKKIEARRITVAGGQR